MCSKSKNLTIKYSVHQVFFWTAYCAFLTYGVAFLLNKGFSASEAGITMFFANFSSFAIQPFIASKADRVSKTKLAKFVNFQSYISIICFTIILLTNLPKLLLSILFFVGSSCLDMNLPLVNSMVIFYNDNQHPINYGVGRACGAIAYGIISILFGIILEKYNSDLMIIIALALIILYILINSSFPAIEDKSENKIENTSSLSTFFKKYKWFVFSLFGVLLLAIAHLMMENYLIEVFTNLGGGGSNVGISLFIATVGETALLIFLTKVIDAFGIKKLLIIGGLSYIIKSILFIFAKSVWVIYLAEFLQISTYTLVVPTQLYYAKKCTSADDMVKGQSLSTAFWAVGCAFGNLLGGVLISAFNLHIMLCGALTISILGLITFLNTVPKAMKIGEKL